MNIEFYMTDLGGLSYFPVLEFVITIKDLVIQHKQFNMLRCNSWKKFQKLSKYEDGKGV